MKATGMVRKIDDLGRIVIPKEIRKALRMRERDALEIYIDSEGEIILKKYAPLGKLTELSESYVEVLTNVTGMSVCITDRTTVIAVAGVSKKEYLDKEINEELIDVMNDRVLWTNKNRSKIKILKDSINENYNMQIIYPIISESDSIGNVIMFSTDLKKQITDVEIKLAQSVAMVLAKQVE